MTEVFANLAVQAARARGYADLPTLVLPHPMETRPADEIVAIARARFEDIVALLAEEAPSR
ncbi:MAG TPA: hypothetical protein VFD92_06190 [Candidatus Binatia bacterium]|nr:hypothetical protein [Candidatus Binatia bacterium]